MSITSAQHAQGEFQQALLCFDTKRTGVSKRRKQEWCSVHTAGSITRDGRTALPLRRAAKLAGRQAGTHLSASVSSSKRLRRARLRLSPLRLRLRLLLRRLRSRLRLRDLRQGEKADSRHVADLLLACYYSCSRSPSQANACMDPSMLVH
jgi:hypothetical protein